MSENMGTEAATSEIEKRQRQPDLQKVDILLSVDDRIDVALSLVDRRFPQETCHEGFCSSDRRAIPHPTGL
jgi:hypothetical protein